MKSKLLNCFRLGVIIIYGKRGLLLNVRKREIKKALLYSIRNSVYIKQLSYDSNLNKLIIPIDFDAIERGEMVNFINGL